MAVVAGVGFLHTGEFELLLEFVDEFGVLGELALVVDDGLKGFGE